VNEEQLDFVEKLLLVEREALMLAADLPPGVMKSRAEYIAMVVSLLKARLDILPAVILPSTRKTEQF
jgi:hypothetical protein